jgi:hypothetical protein
MLRFVAVPTVQLIEYQAEDVSYYSTHIPQCTRDTLLLSDHVHETLFSKLFRKCFDMDYTGSVSITEI